MKLPYENNPLVVSVNGLSQLFEKARSIGIMFVVLIVVGLLLNIPSSFMGGPQGEPAAAAEAQKQFEFFNSVPVEFWVIVGLIVLGIMSIILFLQILLSGISDYTAAKLSKGETTTLSEALSGLFQNFWGYVGVFLLVAVKTFLWSLLFIIPGIYFSYRYSLAGVSFFDKKLTGNAAVKNSLELTKDAWLTTFASHTLLPFLSFGIMQEMTIPGTRAVLYRQFSELGAKPKPAAHIVSWLTLLLPLVLVGLIVLAGIGLFLLAAPYVSAPPSAY